MSEPVEVGDIVGGKYRVEHVLGGGGMGVVYAATHVHLEQRVALKFLTEKAAEDPELVERFAREARAAVKIQSEHVVRIIDVGALASGLPYIVMEYLEGADLGEIVETQGPLSVEQAVRYLLQASEAIAEVHAQGIVHRDIKPANLFLATRADGSKLVKVIDFGISKAASTAEHSTSLTRATAVMGSPRYMSPEQLRASRDVDARADIWAFGITLYELLGGQSPFSGGTMPEVCASILKDPPRSLRDLRSDASPALEAVILGCLAKEPDARYADLAALSAALVPFGPTGSEASAQRIARVLQRGTVSTLSPKSRIDEGDTLRPAPAEDRDTPVVPVGPGRLRELHSIPEEGRGSEEIQAACVERYLARIGDCSRVPRLAVDSEHLIQLALDNRAAFLLTFLDGSCSVEDVLDACGMPRPEALGILFELLEARVVVIDSSPRPR